MVSLKTETLVARRVPTKQDDLARHRQAVGAELMAANPPSAQSKGSFGDRPQPEAAQ
jgi:hypothetical protein